MIRFYKATVYHILLILYWIKYVGRVPIHTMRKDLWDVRDNNPDVFSDEDREMLFENLLNIQVESIPSIEELTEDFRKTSLESYNPSSDLTLIDNIVRILQLPYTMNYLPGKVLSSLRRALLIPSEMAELNTRLTNNETYCGCGCGLRLSDDEAVVVRMRSDSSLTVMALSCVIPDYVSCGDCGQKHEITGPIRKMLHKLSHCGKKKQEEGEEEAPIVDENRNREGQVGPELIRRVMNWNAAPIQANDTGLDAETARMTFVPEGTTFETRNLIPTPPPAQFRGGHPMERVARPFPMRNFAQDIADEGGDQEP